tara:strand:- start:908 stop:1693 length:786 start_codon:yes stop_codon:yes gene_type:complete
MAGKTLRQLWEDAEIRSSIFGDSAPKSDHFPLLCKILDAQERLSIQVHPPVEAAAVLGGEPKTEVWYIAHAEPGACLYVGFKKGVTRASFRAALESGSAEGCVHTIPVETGDHIFIPSGRLHAIGAGVVIYEIQENSDTTYRVYDWARPGMDGQPRQLHIEESMKCINFADIEPTMDNSDGTLLAECEKFRLERHSVAEGEPISTCLRGRFAIGTVISGQLSSGNESLKEGDFFMVPVAADTAGIVAGADGAEWLLTTWPG